MGGEGDIELSGEGDRDHSLRSSGLQKLSTVDVPHNLRLYLPLRS